jgi:mono/diheme cytochrome c family protein
MPDGAARPFLLLVAATIGGFALVLVGVILLAGRDPSAQAAEPTRAMAAMALSTAATTAAPAPLPNSGKTALELQFQNKIKPFLQENCFKCHGNGKHKGDVALDKFTNFASVQLDLDTWQTVRDELEHHDMPPEDEPQPTSDKIRSVLAFCGQAMDFVDPSIPVDPGFVAIHRLNRNEYNDTVRDLVGVDFHPADNFPADDTGYGFDNIADVLSMSPLLAEKYLAAAEQVMDRAIVLDNPNKPKITNYSADKMQGGEVAAGNARELASEGEITQDHKFVATGEYEFRIEAEQDQAGKEAAKMKVSVGGKVIKTFDVFNRRGRNKIYIFRTTVPGGAQTVSMAFINDFYDPKNPNPKKRDRNLYVGSLEIEGPFNVPPPPPSAMQKRLLFCGPADGATGESCAGQIVRAFATRAFRRPATADEVSRLVKLYKIQRTQGESFEQACKVMLTAVLVAPDFLYRIELDPAGPPTPHAISDFELASRLSYFIWGSLPDDQLLDLAGRKTLHQPAVLDQQVKRMLADAKSSAFLRHFTGQWLELRNLSQIAPDPNKFPEFTPALRQDMQKEGELFFRNVVLQDRSVLDFLDANYTFLDQRLANFYGIDGVSGDDFTKVVFTPEQSKRRGGVLTMAAVLTVSALPNRTSPVKRGKFILDQILGTPPPAPPPGVPALPERGAQATPTSVRERLEQHRANPQCAACHAKLDPLGFALENFDAIGRWRDTDGGAAIDSSGSLPSGESIKGPLGLRKVLVANHKEQFLRSFVSKLMTYALGRGTTTADSMTIRSIYRTAEKNDCRFSTIIGGIIHSDAFLKRRAKTAS